MTDEFEFVGKKQLDQTSSITKSILVAFGSKTINNGSHDGADVLGDATMQVFDWESTECWTGQTRNTIRNGKISEIHV